MDSRLRVGSKVYLKPQGNAARYGKTTSEDVITKVARKFFYTEKHGRFFIENMNQDCGHYISNYKAYFSEKDIEVERYCVDIVNKIRVCVNSSLGYEKLTSIADIIGI